MGAEVANGGVDLLQGVMAQGLMDPADDKGVQAFSEEGGTNFNSGEGKIDPLLLTEKDDQNRDLPSNSQSGAQESTNGFFQSVGGLHANILREEPVPTRFWLFRFFEG